MKAISWRKIATLLLIVEVLSSEAALIAEAQRDASPTSTGTISTTVGAAGRLYTKTGYDNLLGVNAICWSARAFSPQDNTIGEDEFSPTIAAAPDLVSGPETIMYECPSGVDIHLDPPIEAQRGELLRTQRSYRFQMKTVINMKAIREQFGLSKNATVLFPVAGRVVFCPPNGNLCSPFVVDQTKAALSNNKRSPPTGGGPSMGHSSSSGSDTQHGDTNTKNQSLTMGNQAIIGDNSAQEDQNSTISGKDNMFSHNSRDTSNSSKASDEMMMNAMNGETRNEMDETEESSSHSSDATHHSATNESALVKSLHYSNIQHNADKHEMSQHNEIVNGQEGARLRHGDFDLGVLAVIESSSDWQFHEVNSEEESMDLYFSFDIFISQPGSYFPLGATQVLLKDESQSSTKCVKIDIANMLHSTELYFQKPPTIRSVTKFVEILVWIAIGIAIFVQLVLLFFTIRYRKEGIMQMSQGSFLILVQVAGLIAASCSFLHNPKSNVHCALSFPLTFIPMQLMLAVIFGRLLRIVTIMGGLMEWNKPQTKTETRRQLQNIPHAVRQSFRNRGSFISNTSSTATGDAPEDNKTSVKRVIIRTRNRSRKLRKKFPATWLWFVIVMVTLPQLILQIVGVAFFRREINVMLNNDENIGRYRCGTPEQNRFGIGFILYFFLTVIATMYEAYKSRNLPALFNEAASVSLALLTTLAVSTLGFTLIMATSQPTSPPDVRYLMLVAMILNFTLNVALRLVLPKLRLIWKGEKVAMNTMLLNHRNDQRRHSPDAPSIPFGTDSPQPSNQVEKREKVTLMPEMLSSDFVTRPGLEIINESNDEMPTNFAEYTKELDVNDDDCDEDMEENSIKMLELKATMNKLKEAGPSELDSMNHSFVTTDGYAPPQKLTVNIIHLNRAAATVNERILSGLAVSKEDWITLRQQVDETQSLLEHFEHS